METRFLRKMNDRVMRDGGKARRDRVAERHAASNLHAPAPERTWDEQVTGRWWGSLPKEAIQVGRDVVDSYGVVS